MCIRTSLWDQHYCRNICLQGSKITSLQVSIKTKESQVTCHFSQIKTTEGNRGKEEIGDRLKVIFQLLQFKCCLRERSQFLSSRNLGTVLSGKLVIFNKWLLRIDVSWEVEKELKYVLSFQTEIKEMQNIRKKLVL